MRDINQYTITKAVIERLAVVRDERLKLITTSPMQDLHAVAPEVELPEGEWIQRNPMPHSHRSHVRRQASGVHFAQ
jgi:hypothetical protein